MRRCMPSSAVDPLETRHRRCLNEIHERKDQNPDEIHEMPVKTSNFNWIGVGGRICTSHRADQQTAEIDHPTGHVHAMEARQNEEGGAEKRCRMLEVMRGMSDTHPFHEDQVPPFIGLEPQEDYTAQDGECQKLA